LTTPVLLLHGQPGSMRDFDPVVAGLGHRRCVVFDRPGWDGVRAPTDLEGNASAALAELDVHGISRAVLVGHSFGGAVAAWLAASFADRVAGVVLLAPSANIASMYAVDRLLAAPVVGPLLSGALVGGAGLVLSVSQVRRALPGEDAYLAAVARRMRSPSAWRAFAVEQRVLFSDLPELESLLGRITAPTRVLAGGADWLVPISSLRALARAISGAELEVIEGAGHLLPVRQPRAVIDAIEAVDRG
jgi:pimeloyl-ACP methyl ester carboxylesterase